MKKIVQTVEVPGQGLEALLGEQVTFFCLNYIYHGKLIGVNTNDVLLENSRCIWRWRGANTLNELARNGASRDEYTRITEPLDEVEILDVCQIVAVTPEAKENLSISRWLD